VKKSDLTDVQVMGRVTTRAAEVFFKSFAFIVGVPGRSNSSEIFFLRAEELAGETPAVPGVLAPYSAKATTPSKLGQSFFRTFERNFCSASFWI